MANIKDNKKGFKVIQISRKELVEELGQYGAMGICDYCNETEYLKVLTMAVSGTPPMKKHWKLEYKKH